MEQATLATAQPLALVGPGPGPGPAASVFTLCFQLLTAFALFFAATFFTIGETTPFTVWVAGLLAYFFVCHHSAGVPPCVDSLPLKLIWLLSIFAGNIFGQDTSGIVDSVLISLCLYYVITGNMADAWETLKLALAKAVVEGIANALPDIVKGTFALLSEVVKGTTAFLSELVKGITACLRDMIKFDNSSSKLVIILSFACFFLVITCAMIIFFAGGQRIIEQIIQNTTDVIKLMIVTGNPDGGRHIP